MGRGQRIFDFGCWILDWAKCGIQSLRQGWIRLWQTKSKIKNTFWTCVVTIVLVSMVATTGMVMAQTAVAMEQRKPAAPPSKQFSASKRQPVKAQLIVEHGSVPPGGSTRIGVRFELEDGWHIYTKDPGDAGLPTSVVWFGSPEISFGPIQWPAFKKFVDPGDIKTNGYTGTVVLPSTVQVASTVPVGVPLTIRATMKWLACKDICLPGSTTTELSLPVSDKPQALSADAKLFEQSYPDQC